MRDGEAHPARGAAPLGLADLLRDAAHQAGALALRWFRPGARTGARIWTKGAQSPVTEADIEADVFLRRRLGAGRPDFGWLSEETADSPDRLSRACVFVVDPIDGTRAFLNGDPRWCVSVAAVVDGAPIAGIVHAPALDLTYEAVADGEAKLNGKLIRVSGAARLDGARVAGPRSLLDALSAAGTGIAAVPKIPSLALRFCDVARGTIDVALASRDANDWDIAAAHLIVERAGGKLADLAGAAPRYNRAGTAHGQLVAASPGVFAGALSRARRAHGLPETAGGTSEHG